MNVRKINQLPADIGKLADEAREQGFRFLDSLVDEFESGSNRFDRPSEALFGVFEEGNCLAIGGINIDPLDHAEDVGRVRRVFVSNAVRGKGVGKMLMSEIETWSHGKFTQLRLFTDTQAASAFYEAIGYESVCGDRVSHVKLLTT